jgi:tetratricopeptide (TPR) repeat protein
MAAKAAENCGATLEQLGDFDGAQRAYRKGMTCSDKALATRLMFALGGLLAKKDDIEGAETAYRETRRLGRQAAAEFNVLIQALGQLTPMSRQYFAPVLNPVHRESVVLAALRLGTILLKRRELDEAETLLREARAAEQSIAVQAAFPLGILLNERGRREEAIAEFR